MGYKACAWSSSPTSFCLLCSHTNFSVPQYQVYFCICGWIPLAGSFLKFSLRANATFLVRPALNLSQLTGASPFTFHPITFLQGTCDHLQLYWFVFMVFALLGHVDISTAQYIIWHRLEEQRISSQFTFLGQYLLTPHISLQFYYLSYQSLNINFLLNVVTLRRGHFDYFQQTPNHPSIPTSNIMSSMEFYTFSSLGQFFPWQAHRVHCRNLHDHSGPWLFTYHIGLFIPWVLPKHIHKTFSFISSALFQGRDTLNDYLNGKYRHIIISVCSG